MVCTRPVKRSLLLFLVSFFFLLSHTLCHPLFDVDEKKIPLKSCCAYAPPAFLVLFLTASYSGVAVATDAADAAAVENQESITFFYPPSQLISFVGGFLLMRACVFSCRIPDEIFRSPLHTLHSRSLSVCVDEGRNAANEYKEINLNRVLIHFLRNATRLDMSRPHTAEMGSTL